MSENTYSFDLPTHHKSIIKVIGVGGGGSNAVNHMFNLGIRDVEFVVCNTDVQALESSPVPNKLQIGAGLTSGLGAGANPEKGRNAAIESKEDIKELLEKDTKMVFITAGMGGGTGTGGAPVIAQVAKELDILTVGIVTVPFAFEGKKKNRAAEEGINALKENCDTVIVISNDKIKEIFGNLPIREAFGQADDVLTTAAKGIAEIITVPGYVNVDFEDVKTVMLNAGAAVMGSAETSGENRARRAAEAALNSPLLNNRNIMGAQKILLSIMSGEEAELQMDELTDITDYIEEFAGQEAEVIFGHGVDALLNDNIRVTLIATGFENIDRQMVLRTRDEKEASSEGVREIRFEEMDLPRNNQTTNENEETKTVFDLESNKMIQQISLFESDKDEEEMEIQRVNDIQDDSDNDHDDLSFDFDFDFPEKDKEEESEELVFDLKTEDLDPVDSEDEYLEDDEDAKLEELEGAAHPPSRRVEWMESRKEREEILESNYSQTKTINPENFKEKWEVPAYERKKVRFQQVPHSSERNISRFSLNDDDQIMGKNKFLHDNVD
jgi:cell division protein FtsZ